MYFTACELLNGNIRALVCSATTVRMTDAVTRAEHWASLNVLGKYCLLSIHSNSHNPFLHGTAAFQALQPRTGRFTFVI